MQDASFTYLLSDAEAPTTEREEDNSPRRAVVGKDGKYPRKSGTGMYRKYLAGCDDGYLDELSPLEGRGDARLRDLRLSRVQARDTQGTSD